MHSSGSITRKFGPSWKQSTGHTSTQSVYLHLMQFSVTTKGMEGTRVRWRGHFSGLCASCGRMPLWERLQPRALAPSPAKAGRSEEHTSELQSLMRISYAVFCLKKKTH